MGYNLDFHCLSIIDEFKENYSSFEKIKEIVLEQLKSLLKNNNILVTAVEARIKAEESLAGKLELKGYKYKSLSDITDIVGARVITFYTDEVDKISALVETVFDIDRHESVDKRKMHELNSLGYMSLHYICRIPKTLYYDEKHPEINEYRFEIQMRTALQHVWANMYHDTGYKSGVEIPPEYLRSLTCLAGMLELADAQFSRIRTEINDYRRHVHSLVQDGNFDDVPLNGDTFKSYLDINPFARLTTKIAAINQAEVYADNFMPYLDVMKKLGFKTLGDIEKMKSECSDAAYQIALHQIGGTDLDIVAATISIQNLCIVHIIKKELGEAGITAFYNRLYGESDYNKTRAKRIMELAEEIGIGKKE
ncbi:MAG: hypothetical protein J5862_02570 [Bacteroidales bacterium]|nr:hypothetical protein [Bacteroidales bacterium]